MRIHHRYIKRVVIPVVATGLIALLINFAVHERVEDEYQATDPFTLSELAKADVPYSPEAVETEIAALESALESLDQAAESATEADSAKTDVVAQQREQVQRKIQALSSATPENWGQRRAEAYEELEAYADVVGSQAIAAGNETGQ